MCEIKFRQVIIPEEIPALCDFDRLAFHAHPADVFPAEEWRRYESYWMVLDGRIVGCTALQKNSNELWITSTAVLPELRRQGLGSKLKEWQIEYARSHGFERLGTVMRQSNEAMIRLNEKFGFERKRLEPHRYAEPDETGIVMELILPSHTCPKCGQQLRTRRAKQCRFCGADWH